MNKCNKIYMEISPYFNGYEVFCKNGKGFQIETVLFDNIEEIITSDVFIEMFVEHFGYSKNFSVTILNGLNEQHFVKTVNSSKLSVVGVEKSPSKHSLDFGYNQKYCKVYSSKIIKGEITCSRNVKRYESSYQLSLF